MGNKFLHAISNMPRPNPRKRSGFTKNMNPDDNVEIKEVRWIGIPMARNPYRKGEVSEFTKGELGEAMLYTHL